MYNKLKIINYFFIGLIALFLFFSFTNFSLADGLQSARDGLDASAQEGFGDVDDESIASKIGRFVGVLLSFVGVLFMLLIIYAGFTWMLARGNEAEAKKAKDLMYDAVIGLVVILAAYAITAFVGSRLT